MQADLTGDINTPEDAVIDFEYGNLMLTCSCGASYPLDKCVPKMHGVQIVVVPNSKSSLTLKCQECEHQLAIRFVESSVEEIAEFKAAQNESVPEASQETQIDDAVLVDDQQSI